MKISYNWLKSYIEKLPSEDDLTKKITFYLCEVEGVEKKENGDTIFDLNVLPDRAHDLLCHKGLANELSGLLGLKTGDRKYKLPEIFSKTNLKVEIETSNCPRYMGRIIKGVKVGPSPKWMVEYLTSIGQRSINNIVDSTNIVLFDIGQPIHAFDLKQLSGELIIVKQAKNDEKIELVGSEKLTATLKDSDMMITDGKKNLAIAGVKGGLGSGVSDDTVDLLIEVASFDSVSVRKTARRLGILTEASKRYENKIPASLCDEAMDEITMLLYEIFPRASFEEVVDNYKEKEEERSLSFSRDYISKILGINISENEIEDILKSYNYEYKKEEGIFKIKIPSRRLDINGPHDMAEEIGRVYGYENIKPLLPKIDQKIKNNIIWDKINFAKQKLISEGYREVMTYVFRDKGELEVLASASDKNYLKTNLTDSLRESIELNQKNLPLLGIDEVRIFEVGTVFVKKGEEIHVAYGDKKNITEIPLEEFVDNISPDFHSESTNIILSENFSARPSRPAQVSHNENPVLYINDYNIQIFKPWSVYPFIVRDIAVWIPEGTKPERLIDIYKDFGTELLIREPKLFDSFSKNKKTSFAYRLVFQADDRTLTDEEINKIMLKITEKITSLGWEVR